MGPGVVPRRRQLRAGASAAALAATLALAATASAAPAPRDLVLRSADGTPIVATFMPAAGLADGAKAPTILQTHGFGGSRDRDPEAGPSTTTGQVGVRQWRAAGFNVMTWDSRGFGDSGGEVTVDGPETDGRDAQAVISAVAAQPESELDGPGDPRAGWSGVSYAGGIQLVTAGLDRRVDAINPIIAWQSLQTSLYREELVKLGWGSLLIAGGLPGATADGLDSPAGPQTGAFDRHIPSAIASGAATGRISQEDRDFFVSRGPGAELVSRIRVPTLLTQGTADTLFTPSEALRNDETLRANSGQPVKMFWFCGGHGVCRTNRGDAELSQKRSIDWMRRWVMRRETVDVGPRFEWIDDGGATRQVGLWPAVAGAARTATGAGRLVVSPADVSGSPIFAAPAAGALNVDVPQATRSEDWVGEPRLRLRYRGTGTATHVFAQLVDVDRGVAVGNQATPVAVTLDGTTRTKEIGLNAIAARPEPGSRYRLQITGGSALYGPQRGAGVLDVAEARVELPVIDVAATNARAAAGLPDVRTCLSGRAYRIRLKQPRGDRIRRAVVRFGGTRLTVTYGRRATALVDLRGRRAGRYRVTADVRTRSGRRIRDRRTYTTCRAGTRPGRDRGYEGGPGVVGGS